MPARLEARQDRAPGASVRATARSLGDVVRELVARPKREALLSRVVERWPWRSPAGGRLGPALPWPDGVELGEVARWAVEAGSPLEHPGAPSCMVAGWEVTPAELALLFLAVRDIDAGLREPALAVDAGRPHHHLLTGWRDMPKDHTRSGATWSLGDRMALLPPPDERGQGVQLSLPLADLGAHGATVEALRRLRSWEGLRTWAALLRLLSVEGGRRGWVRWTMRDHLDALEVSPRTRSGSAFLARTAALVEWLTRLELVLYQDGGQERARAPLVHVGARFEHLAGSRWQLDGMELRINEWLYDGIRPAGGGRLGKLWWPAPVALSTISHVQRPYALALGLLLPIRWRWKLWDGCDHLPLTGAKLLELAGIRWEPRHAARSWGRLRDSLEELQRVGLLGRVEWAGEPEALTTTCRLYPSEWSLDRAVRGLVPVEAPPVVMPTTGAELRGWRLGRGWTQEHAAELLGVSRSTVARAEQAPGALLGHRIGTALGRLGAMCE